MDFLDKLRGLFGRASDAAPSTAALTPDASLSVLTPMAPALQAERYNDSNYAVSRQLEARKIHVMNRICAANNAAAEDVIDRRGTIARPARPSRPAAQLTAQEQLDAVNLAEVTYVMEKNHDPRR